MVHLAGVEVDIANDWYPNETVKAYIMTSRVELPFTSIAIRV